MKQQQPTEDTETHSPAKKLMKKRKEIQEEKGIDTLATTEKEDTTHKKQRFKQWAIHHRSPITDVQEEIKDDNDAAAEKEPEEVSGNAETINSFTDAQEESKDNDAVAAAPNKKLCAKNQMENQKELDKRKSNSDNKFLDFDSFDWKKLVKDKKDQKKLNSLTELKWEAVLYDWFEKLKSEHDMKKAPCEFNNWVVLTLCR